MMLTSTMRVVTLALIFGPVALAAQMGPATLRIVQRVDLNWLHLIDASNYQGAWDTAGPLFHSISETKFAESVARARKPLGALESRTPKSTKGATSLPGLPDGHYFIEQYDSKFANKAAATETVVCSLEDGKWQVSGYFIR